jgi:hypothetical protein
MRVRLYFLLIFLLAADRYNEFSFIKEDSYQIDFHTVLEKDTRTSVKILSKSDYEKNIVKNHINHITKELFIYIKDKFNIDEQCEDIQTLQVIFLSEEELNSFKYKLGQSRPNIIVGLFAMSRNDRSTATIFISVSKNIKSDILFLAHEMAHLWYERFCLKNLTSYSTEHFAYSFENYYAQKIGECPC